MPSHVVAFEGGTSPRDGVTWGAAAILVDDQFINSITRVACQRSELDQLIARNKLVVLPEPASIRDEDLGEPLIVVQYPSRGQYAKYFKKKFRKSQLASVEGPQQYYAVYRSREAFRMAAESVIDRALKDLVEQPAEEELGNESLLRFALTLDRAHPGANALWALQYRRKIGAVEIARANVGASGLQKFEELFSAMGEMHNEVIVLNFTGGEADRGGFSLPTHSSVVSSLDNVYGFEATRVVFDNGFLPEEVPPLSFQERMAASVHWSFSLHDDDDTFGKRLSKVLVMRAMRRSVSTGASGIIQEEARRAYRTLIRPAPGVSMTVSCGDEELQGVEVEFPDTEVLWWAKRLSASDAQVVREGRPVPYLRLTKSICEIDHVEWFRNTMFSDLDWTAGYFGRTPVERAEAEFAIWIQGLYYGKMTFELSHAERRALSHGHPPTWIHWNDALLNIFSSGFYVGHWVTIERWPGPSWRLVLDSAMPQRA